MQSTVAQPIDLIGLIFGCPFLLCSFLFYNPIFVVNMLKDCSFGEIQQAEVCRKVAKAAE